MRSEFHSINDFFLTLNQAGINYLVLRNYENLLQPEMYLDGHGDIDLLCDDAASLVQAAGAKPCPPKSTAVKDDKIHYRIHVGGQPVSLDLRQVGDGYYCQRWGRDLLQHRVRHECFYVMNDEDYFFTLAYHAILQKRSLSDEYRARLGKMAQRLGVKLETCTERNLVSLVEAHMREKGYSYTFTVDRMVPNRYWLIKDKGLIDMDYRLWWNHLKFDMKVAAIGLMVKAKHMIKR